MKTASYFLPLLLAGCAASPYQYMVDNRYGEIEPMPAPAALIGTWTGTNGPYLLTIRVNADGRGLTCASWHKHESVNNLKYADGRLYFPDGMELTMNAQGGRLMATYDQKGMAPMHLRPDPNLVEASPYCKDKLR